MLAHITKTLAADTYDNLSNVGSLEKVNSEHLNF